MFENIIYCSTHCIFLNELHVLYLPPRLPYIIFLLHSLMEKPIGTPCKVQYIAEPTYSGSLSLLIKTKSSTKYLSSL